MLSLSYLILLLKTTRTVTQKADEKEIIATDNVEAICDLHNISKINCDC